jgi:hypothetical protein
LTWSRIFLLILILALLITTVLIAHPGAADSPYQLSGQPIQRDAGR